MRYNFANGWSINTNHAAGWWYGYAVIVPGLGHTMYTRDRAWLARLLQSLRHGERW